MSAKASFRRKPISEQAVAAAEASAAGAPIVGDPRIGAPTPAALDASAIQGPLASTPAVLGSSQESPGDAHTGDKIIHVPLSQIRSNPHNPRVIYSNAAIDEMAMQLTTDGQIVPAPGFIAGDGAVVLIDGERRLRGARAAGLATLRIELRAAPKDDRELYELARAANVKRRDQTPLDDGIRWKELLASKVYNSQAALAKALNVGEDVVSRTLSLAALSKRVILVAAEYPELLNLKMLNAIREFCDQQGDEATIDLVHEAAKAGLGYRDVVARRRAAEKGPIHRPRSIREPLSFSGAKGEIKTFEQDGRLELVLKGLSADEAATLVARFKQALTQAKAQ